MTAPRTVRLTSAGRAQDGALLAAADVASIAAADRVPARETADADFGVPYELAAAPQLLSELRAHGYEQASGNRFVRTEEVPGALSALDLVIDILTPSYTGRLESNQPRGDLVVDEVPGLQLALARPGVHVRAAADLTTGQSAEMDLVLPDPLSALCLKAYAYRGRMSDRDALDVWRLLEVAREAGTTPADWSGQGARRDAQQQIIRSFGRAGAPGTTRATSSRAEQARIRALVAAVVGTS